MVKKCIFILFLTATIITLFPAPSFSQTLEEDLLASIDISKLDQDDIELLIVCIEDDPPAPNNLPDDEILVIIEPADECEKFWLYIAGLAAYIEEHIRLILDW